MRPLRCSSVTLWIVCMLATGGTAIAQSPFAGTWKINPELSQLAGDTLSFGPAAEDSIEYIAGGIKYSFRADGKNYRMPSGDIAIWRESGPDGWSTEYRKTDGKLLSSDTWKVSEDGKTLTVTSTGVKANGDLYTDTETYERTKGTSGLLGSWKGTKATLSSPSLFVIQEAGLDNLILRIPAMKAMAKANFGGREVPVEGPDVPTGLRLSLTRKGPYTFHLVQKLNGTVIHTADYTISNEGKTMTEVGGAPGDPPTSVVWEKQAPAPPAPPADHPSSQPVLPAPGVH
jgi:hypothetical protein